MSKTPATASSEVRHRIRETILPDAAKTPYIPPPLDFARSCREKLYLHHYVHLLTVAASRDKIMETSAHHAQVIDEHIRNAHCDTGRIMRAFQSDKYDAVKVYNLPRNLLRLNPNNGRFKAELDIIHQERKEKNKPIELDSNNPDDIRVLQQMIKGKHPRNVERAGAYKQLRDNIHEVAQKTGTNGQEVPGLITHDGILVNGNRRWTIMEDLASGHKKEPSEPLKYDKMLVGRLNTTVTRYELWKNEAKEQISQESREEYDYVNSALEIQRGYDLLKGQGMSDKKAKEEIAKTLYGKSRKDVEGYIEFLDVARIFLELVGKDEQYTYLQESGSDDQGIVTILQEVAKDRSRYQKQEMDPNEFRQWFKAVSMFCVFSKKKLTATSTSGELKPISFGHRHYREFKKKVMSTKETKSRFFELGALSGTDMKNLTDDDAISFYNAAKEAQELYDIQEGISTPASLLKKAVDTLIKVTQDLNDHRSDEMINLIKQNNGVQHIAAIKALINEISEKLTPTATDPR